ALPDQDVNGAFRRGLCRCSPRFTMGAMDSNLLLFSEWVDIADWLLSAVSDVMHADLVFMHRKEYSIAVGTFSVEQLSQWHANESRFKRQATAQWKIGERFDGAFQPLVPGPGIVWVEVGVVDVSAFHVFQRAWTKPYAEYHAFSATNSNPR